MKTILLPWCCQQGVCMCVHECVISWKQSGKEEAFRHLPDDVCEVKVWAVYRAISPVVPSLPSVNVFCHITQGKLVGLHKVSKELFFLWYFSYVPFNIPISILLA